MADVDEDMDEDLDQEDDNESEGGSGDENTYEPPSEEEWTRTKAALVKANAEAKKHRLARREAQKSNGSTAGSADTEALKAAAAKEVEDKYVPRIKRSAAKTALVAAGLVDADKADVLKSAVRLVDLDDLDVDEDGDVEGLDEAISELKSKFPAMFRKAKVKGQVSTGSRGDGGKGGDTGKKPSSASRLAASLKG